MFTFISSVFQCGIKIKFVVVVVVVVVVESKGTLLRRARFGSFYFIYFFFFSGEVGVLKLGLLLQAQRYVGG